MNTHQNASIVSQENTETVKPLSPTLTDEQADKVQTALRSFYNLFSRGDWSTKGPNEAHIESFDIHNPEQRETLCSRALLALTNYQSRKERAEVAKVRKLIEERVSQATEAARVKLTQFDALPSDLRASLGDDARDKLTKVRIPVPELAPIFGADLTTEQVNSRLKTLGYTMGKGRLAKDQPTVVIDLDPKPMTPRPPTAKGEKETIGA